MLKTVKQSAIWERMKVEEHPQYKQIIYNTTWDRYNDLGRWELVRYLITGDEFYGKKAFAELKGVLSNFTNIFKGNESREFTIELAMMYDALKPVMTPEENAAFKAYLVAVCDKIISGLRIGDSDQTTGNYFGLALVDKVAGTKYLEGTYIDPTNGKAWPVGGLKSTAADYSSMRNAVRLFVEKMGEGGDWPESSEYNRGTTWHVVVGGHWAGIENFPEIKKFTAERARQQMWELTPDLKNIFQFGDVQAARQLTLTHGLPDLWAALSYFLDEDDPTLAAQFRQFEADVYAANKITTLSPLYARYYYFNNPYGRKEPWRKDGIYVTKGVGHIFFREGQQGSMFESMNWNNGAVDHFQTFTSGDFRVYKDGKFIVDHPIGYGLDPRYYNQLITNGVGPSNEVGGIIASHYVPGKVWYGAGMNAGFTPLSWENASGQTGEGDAYTDRHEHTRSLLQLLDGTDLCLIVVDRIHVTDIKLQSIKNKWGLFDFDKLYTYQRMKDAVARALGVTDWVFHTPVAPTLTPDGFTYNDVTVKRLFPAALETTVIEDAKDLTLGGYIQAAEKKWSVHEVLKPHVDFQVQIRVIYTGNVVCELVDKGDFKGVRIKRPGLKDTYAFFSAKPGPRLKTTMAGNLMKYDRTKFKLVRDARLLDPALKPAAVAGSITYYADLTEELEVVSNEPIPDPDPQPTETASGIIKQIQVDLEKLLKILP